MPGTFYEVHDSGALRDVQAAGSARVTAGGSGDATEVSGVWIDRDGYKSVKVAVAVKATLAEDETISIAANLRDASDSSGTDAADFSTTVYSNAVVATGDTGGSTEYAVATFDVDVSGAKQYIQVQFTPDMSASGTDTADVFAVAVLGGMERIGGA